MALDTDFCVKVLECANVCVGYTRLSDTSLDPGYGTATFGVVSVGDGNNQESMYEDNYVICSTTPIVLTVGQAILNNFQQLSFYLADLPLSWLGHVLFPGDCSDGTPTCPFTPTASLVCEQNPTNPCVVSVAASTSIDDPCAMATSSTLEVKVGGVSQGTIATTNDIADLSAFAGQTITVCYLVTYDCGTITTVAADECTINVPNFNRELTVNPALPASTTNFQTLAAGAAAIQNGDRLTISAGTYAVNQNGEGGRFDFNSHRDICVVGEGTVILDGSASTSNELVRASRSVNSRFQNLTLVNAPRWGMFNQESDGLVLDNFNVDGITRSGNDGIGVYMYGGANTTIVNSEFQNIQGIGIYLFAAPGPIPSTNTHIENVLSHHNMDGLQVKQSAGTFVTKSEFYNNYRSGIITTDPLNTSATFEDNDIYRNEDAGIQVENGATNQVIRGNRLYENNTYITGGGGEAAIWIDDSVGGLIEFNEVFGNHNAIRVAANMIGSTATQSTDYIVRYNRVYNNNANITGDAPGNDEALGITHGQRVFVYHNTFSGNGNNDTNFADVNGVRTRQTTLTPNSNLFFVNNIVQSTVENSSGTAKTLSWFSDGAEFDRLDNNIYFDGPNATPYELVGIGSGDFAFYQANVLGGHEVYSVEADPMLDLNLVPQAGSPALGSAADLAEITSLSGTTIGLDYSGVFYAGDLIQFADGSTATVSSVGSTSVQVDAIPASAAVTQGVTLFSCDGTDEVGAVQVSSASVPFTAAGLRWEKADSGQPVTWKYTDTNNPTGFSSTALRDEVERAVQKWTSVSGVLMTETTDANADIEVMWDTSGDGPGGILAFVFQPTVGTNMAACNCGDVFADDAELWTQQDFHNVILHEIGHGIGLSHTNDLSPPVAAGFNVMDPLYAPGTPDLNFGGSDIEQTRIRYGT